MIADIIATAIAHPFITGMIAGGCAFGGPLGIIGWCIGYDHAMRKVGEWMRPVPKLEPIHGDVPNLPPQRRFIPTVRS